MFFCQNYRPTQNSQNSTEFASHDFCESPRRLRETIHSAWFCVFRVKNSKQVRGALCSFVKIIVPQKFVLFKFRESLRRLRETKKVH